MKQSVGASIKVFQVSRKKDDAKRIAIAPLDLDLSAICEHVVLDEPAKPAQAESNADRRNAHALWFLGVRLR